MHFFPLMYFIVIVVFGALNLFIDIYTGSFGLGTIATIISAVVWATYLKMSVRVSNTFARNWQGEELEEKVFGIRAAD